MLYLTPLYLRNASVGQLFHWGLFHCVLVAGLGLPIPSMKTGTSVLHAEEGMIPISELASVDLRSRGLQLTAQELFSPGETSLVDGICRVNGCTGSFVSPNGLIITNHHCAYGAIQLASTRERDLLADGFLASDLAEEIPAPGYVVRVTESYEDVSEQVLSVVEPGMDFLERTKAIERRSRELEREAESARPGLRAEVAEMFAGKTYGLFLYTYLRDVRLVFAPPAAVGNFGGDVDNWEWPRHTGDFAFMRAYTAPDGSSATYDSANIPFRPKKFVKVKPTGANEGDAVFLLGYPGRTARHKTASFLEFEQTIRLPLTVELYQWQIEEMAVSAAEDREVELKMTTRMKSLANVEKRSRGQLQGLDRANLVQQRRDEEKQLQQYIDADPERREKYGQVLNQLDRTYQEISSTYPVEFHLEQLRTVSRLLATAFFVVDAVTERAKPDIDRESIYADKNFEQSLQVVKNSLKDLHLPNDERMATGLLSRLSRFPEAAEIDAVSTMIEHPEHLLSIMRSSRLGQPAVLEELLELDVDSLVGSNDPLLEWMLGLYLHYVEMREQSKRREGELNELYGLLMDVKQQFQSTDFIPDANGTLRLTTGRIRAYSPADAIVKMPVTTLVGVMEKTTGEVPFVTPEKVLRTWSDGKFGGYLHPQLGEIPVAILYDTDTTGGNSGSPVLNERGELVGVNFDRCFEATINDFAWNDRYSRSIGVDIRYVLWIVDCVYGADNLIQEMLPR